MRIDLAGMGPAVMAGMSSPRQVEAAMKMSDGGLAGADAGETLVAYLATLA